MKSRNRTTRRYSREYVEHASGVAWYDRSQWERLRQVASDPERLEESYEEWVAVAERAIRELEASGVLIERVPIDVEELVAWSNSHNRRVDSATRAEFAALLFRRMHRSA